MSALDKVAASLHAHGFMREMPQVVRAAEVLDVCPAMLTEAILDGCQGEFGRLNDLGVESGHQADHVMVRVRGTTVVTAISESAVLVAVLAVSEAVRVIDGGAQ